MDLNYWLIRGGLSVLIFIIAKLVLVFINHSIERIDKYGEKKGLSALDISSSNKRVISQFSKYIIYGAAFLLVLYVFELNDLLMGVVTAAGVSGIAIGFAAKDLISNALSGVILMFDRPFSIGDEIEVGRWIKKGEVKSIGIRNTVLRAMDGKMISVPNSVILSEFVVNHSSYPKHLVDVTVELDVDSNVKKALKLIDEFIDKLEWKTRKPKSYVRVADVNKDEIILDIGVWTSEKRYGARKAELFHEIRALLKKNRIKSAVVKE
jgi:small-conductance mechanosensitive channel